MPVRFLSVLVRAASLACFLLAVQSRPVLAMGSAPEKLETLRLAAYDGDVGALEWIAKDKGFFEQAGLLVEMQGYASGKAATDALRGGQADVATAAEFVFASLCLSSDQFGVIGNVSHYRNKAVLARKDRGITFPRDLKGKRVGVTVPSGAEYSLYVFLAQNGLTPQDITQVALAPKDLVEAMAKGNIDAAMTWQPHVQAIERRLGREVRLFPGESYDQFLLLVVRQQDVLTRAPALRKLLTGLLLAEDWVFRHPQEARHYLAQRFQLDPDYVESLWPRMRLTVNLPQELMTALDGEASWMLRRNGDKNRPAVPDFVRFIVPGPLRSVRPEAVTVIVR